MTEFFSGLSFRPHGTNPALVRQRDVLRPEVQVRRLVAPRAPPALAPQPHGLVSSQRAFALHLTDGHEGRHGRGQQIRGSRCPGTPDPLCSGWSSSVNDNRFLWKNDEFFFLPIAGPADLLPKCHLQYRKVRKSFVIQSL